MRRQYNDLRLGYKVASSRLRTHKVSILLTIVGYELVRCPFLQGLWSMQNHTISNNSQLLIQKYLCDRAELWYGPHWEGD